MLASLGRVIQGKEEVLRNAVTCLIAGGHLLLEDVPGTGKTTLAKALAVASGLGLQRIQMTSDLLPQDLTGASYPALDSAPDASRGRAHFRFLPGPVFSELLLADELNRTPPRTQSALLEAMAERAVTIEGERHPLPWPFFVIATQNPIEFAGTFPLPESQLDRFMMRLSPGYPHRDAERQLMRDRRSRDPLDALIGSASAPSVRDAIRDAMAAVDHITVAEPILDYLLDLVAATRTAGAPHLDQEVESLRTSPFLLGVSPRAALDLDRAARARALLEGRDHVIPEDVFELIVPVLAHRLVPAEAGYDGRSDSASLLLQIIRTIPVPRLSRDGAIER
ncbi:AAA family ATPase [Saltatorellus ferox]|uniref:AAA family ATPase n=1 Tax=Saltatorellus ferox TaxID=2528018 RepID=UPI003AF3AE17